MLALGRALGETSVVLVISPAFEIKPVRARVGDLDHLLADRGGFKEATTVAALGAAHRRVPALLHDPVVNSLAAVIVSRAARKPGDRRRDPDARPPDRRAGPRRRSAAAPDAPAVRPAERPARPARTRPRTVRRWAAASRLALLALLHPDPALGRRVGSSSRGTSSSRGSHGAPRHAARQVVVDRLVSRSGRGTRRGGGAGDGRGDDPGEGPRLTHLNFFTEDMSGVGPSDPFTTGGILHAIVGTMIEVAIAVAIAMPLGVGGRGLHVGGRWRGSRVVRTVVEAMTALPSIVAGLFVYSAFIVQFGMPASGSGGRAGAAVMALPIMARAATSCSGRARAACARRRYAMGAGKWQTVWKVVLPTARPGLATALILGIARAVGETAPVLLTSGASTFLNTNPTQDPMNSLPLFIYASIQSGSPQMEERAYAAAAVLLVLVLTLFVDRPAGRRRKEVPMTARQDRGCSGVVARSSPPRWTRGPRRAGAVGERGRAAVPR